MIEKVKISNFKSIESLELDLGRVNVLIGENGCGKTNILEALAVGSCNINHHISPETINLKGARSVEPRSYFNIFLDGNFSTILSLKESGASEIHFLTIYDPSSNSWTSNITNKESVYNSKGSDLIRKYEDFIKALKKAEIKYSHEELRNTFGEDFNMMVESMHIDYPFFKQIKEFSDVIDNEKLLHKFLIYAPENTFLRRFEDEGQVEPLGIRGEGLFKELQKIIRNQPEKFQEIKEGLKAIDWFEDMELPEDLFVFEKRLNIKDRYLGSNPDVQFLDQRSANEGFLFLLFYFTLFVSDDTPKFFAIDNIDQALNPRLCIKLMQTLTEMAKQHDKQVIFTTHNPSILDGLNLDDDEQRLHVVYRNADGNTVAKRHQPVEPLPGVKPVRLSEAFIRGYLGGLPKHF